MIRFWHNSILSAPPSQAAFADSKESAHISNLNFFILLSFPLPLMYKGIYILYTKGNFSILLWNFFPFFSRKTHEKTGPQPCFSHFPLFQTVLSRQLQCTIFTFFVITCLTVHLRRCHQSAQPLFSLSSILVMLSRVIPRVDILWRKAEVPGARIPASPRMIRPVLNPITNR